MKDTEQKVFKDIKSIVAHNTLLAYTDFNKKQEMHNNASDYNQEWYSAKKENRLLHTVEN